MPQTNLERTPQVHHQAIPYPLVAPAHSLGSIANPASPRRPAARGRYDRWTVEVAAVLLILLPLAVGAAYTFNNALNGLFLCIGAVLLVVLISIRHALLLRENQRLALSRSLVHQPHPSVHDPLTGLANRELFCAQLKAAITRAKQHNRNVTLLLLDLDDFKTVNDSLGHDAGDELLMIISQRLRTCVRPADLIARLGGDEFALLLESAPGAPVALEVAQRILQALKEPLQIQAKEFSIHGSIGIASALAGESADDLLRNADVAMYTAKQRGAAGYAVFAPQMHAEALTRLDLEIDLLHALSRNEFLQYYQPIVDVATGEWIGFEALIRWQHPTRGLLLPAAFIDFAEHNGHMIAIGKWCLHDACRQLVVWQAAAPSCQKLIMSVNLSMRQFLHPALAEDLAATLAEVGLAPQQLMIEITENVALKDTDTTLRTLAALRRLGVQLAIDDFGTGFSALSYLKQFDVDTLKLDRSFVVGVEEHESSRALVSAIIAFAQRLGLNLIIEGVETKAQWALLQSLGCTTCQGYFFARPLPPELIDSRLRS